MERDPLRSISQTGVFVLFWLLAVTVLGGPLDWVGGQLVRTTVTPFIGSVVATFLCWKIYEEAPLPHLGLELNHRGVLYLWTGIAAGIVGAALALLPGLMLHLAHFTSVPEVHWSFDTTSFVTILIFCGAAGEELLFHGFAFQSLMNGLGPFAAIFPVGVIFGLLHMGNPDAWWLSTLNTVGFGIVFGCALYRSRSLWLPVGMHFGWNIALPFFGVKISGITMRVTDYEMTWNAGPLWSGGAYGPEGSLLTSGVLILMLLFVWLIPTPETASESSETLESEPSL